METNSEKIILITGATGKQGGATLTSLLKSGWKSRVLLRNKNTAKAAKVISKGAEVFEGDFDDRQSLVNAMQGVYGVFGIQNYVQAGYEGEVRQGKLLADVALTAGVKHFVYTSVDGANRNTGIRHFDSKGEIEKHIVKLKLPYTILRPAMFFENIRDYRFLSLTFFRNVMKSAPSKMIATEDIGEFATIVFNAREKYLEKAIELATEELNYSQILKILKEKGHKTTSIPFPANLLVPVSGDIGIMFKWLSNNACSADIEECRRMLPTFTSFEKWINK